MRVIEKIKAFLQKREENKLIRMRHTLYNKDMEYLKRTSPNYFIDIPGRPYIGILSPLNVVMKTIDNYFLPDTVQRMGIMGIWVDTQDTEVNKVDVYIKRPGLLIGKGGKDIEYIERKLSEIFCKKTVLNITEIKKDVNEPCWDHCW